MKSLNFKQLVIILGLGLLGSNFALAGTSHKAAAADSRGSSTAATPSLGMDSSYRYGLGYSAATSLTGSATSVTGLIELRGGNMIQGYLSVPSTSPFEFTVGANFKHTIAESQNAGFHIGGGAILGTLAGGAKGGSAFALGLDGIAGIHFSLAGASHVQIHLDGGPCLNIIDGNSNFSIGALSGLLGASVIYMF
jgi:hypothetical protein